jgi:hypothetical protein
MLKALWGRITGADAKKQYPAQQAAFLGRLGDYVILHPYGSFCDLPAEALLLRVGEKAALAATVKRPSDTARGEPVLFHPSTNTRIIFRNNGDLDILTDEVGGSVNVKTVNANIEASGNLTATVGGTATVDAPNTVITGNLTVQGSTALGSTVTSNGKDISDTHIHSGVTPGGGNSGPPV